MHVDNVGAIFLFDNTSVYQRMKHIDVNNHFSCDYVEDGNRKIQLDCSEQNQADKFTNNLSNVPFESPT